MLVQLSIKHLAIIDNLSLNFLSGMNILTGETGVGKSILLAALNLALGDRASSNMIKSPHTQAEVSVCFDLTCLPTVRNWLSTQDLAEEQDCIIRRIINTDGRSKAYINGHMVTLNQLRLLGEQLVNIHSQHQHHALLSSSNQKILLDQYAEHRELLQQVKQNYKALIKLQEEYKQLTKNQDNDSVLQLLEYQIKEIEDLALAEDELATLEQEHKCLAKGQELLETAQVINQNLQENISIGLNMIAGKLREACAIASSLQACGEFIDQAIIQIDEAKTEVQNFIEGLDLNPEKLIKIEQRLDSIYHIARKHHISPKLLNEHYQKLCKERDDIINKNNRLINIKEEIEFAQKTYFALAKKLSQSRIAAGKKLAVEIKTYIKSLAMPNAKFNIEVTSDDSAISATGIDNINFMVTTNPGQPLQPLKQIASGGELSRISLAIQVVFAKKIQPPTLVFDEVDTGISGKTAEIVGQLLKELSLRTQVLCITHLPQVAAKGTHHFKVSKHQSKDSTTTTIEHIEGKARIEELAQLLGGISITKEALANAVAMLESA